MGKDRVDAGRPGVGRAGTAVGQSRATPSAEQTPPAAGGGAPPRRDRARGAGGGGRSTAGKSRRRKSNRQFYAALAVLALAGGGVLAYVATRPKETVRTVDPNLPPAKAEGYLMGNPSAPVQIIEFADFECPACGQFATITEPDVRTRLVETGMASYRFYDFPLNIHRNTWAAHNAAACANEQGKFWPMHDRIFIGQGDWNTQATRNPKGVMEGYAKELGLDVGRWEDCYDAQKFRPQIEANQREGERRQVGQTPTFIIGNKQYAGGLPYDELKRMVTEAAAAAGATTAGAAATAPPAAKK
ncbi:MAG TPA: thioredoxin domain-containing protein [Gemmatimonadaceae bacterium]|nr:thioredoxin domain-containing protein [Gemmatimonadaceae bacterium]